MSKSPRKVHRPPLADAPDGAAPITHSPPAPEPTTPSVDHEPVQTVGHPGGCYIKDGAPVNANGEPIPGYVVIDGTVYRIARLISNADV